MYCPDCEIRLPYNKAPDLTDCTICGKPMRSTVQDLLEFGQYGIAREIRPTQIEMGTDIEEVLESEEPQVFLAEGGTGVGKSFAYLIPALLMDDKRVVVSTAKKSLQHQLYDKDVPFLREKMGKDFEVCLYMGTNNYACWNMIKEVPRQDRAKFTRFVDAARNQKIPADLSRWEGSRPYWWDSVSVKTCIRSSSCPHYKYCRPHPKDARVVIVNHYLLAIDIMKNPGSLVGPYDILVIDEAHQAPEAFRTTYSQSLKKNIGDSLWHSLKNNDALREMMQFGTKGLIDSNITLRQLSELDIQINALHKEAKQHSHKKTGIVNGEPLKDVLNIIRDAAHNLSNLLVRAKVEAHKNYSSGVFSDGRILPEEQIPVVLSKFQYLARRVHSIQEFAENMGQFDWGYYNTAFEDDDDEEKINAYQSNNFICTVNDSGITLQPVEIGKIVGPRLCSIPKRLVLSATLALNNKFDYVKNELGLSYHTVEGLNTTEKIYPSPFQLGRQARLYIPRDLPLPEKLGSPQRSAWVQAVAKESARLIKMMGGDAFILFSARTDLEEVRDAFTDGKLLSQHNLPLLVQDDDGDATNVQRRYMRTNNCTLLGLKSFWEGIDIPGDKLRLVIIPKLPFPVPTDPLIKTLSDKAGDEFFNKVFIPRMIFDIKQAAGRLIRTKTDYGVVAVLDPRVWSGSGGSNQQTHYKFMETLKYAPPKMRKPRWYGKTVVSSLGFPLYQDSFTKLQTFVNNCLNNVKER